MSLLSKKYRYISRRLTNFELQHSAEDDLLLSADDIYDDLVGKDRTRKFLDFYSENGIKIALERYGYMKKLKQKGFDNILINIDTTDPYKHIFRLYYDVEQADHVLVELFIRKKSFIAHPVFQSEIKGEVFNFLYIEWFTMQNPTIPFSPERPPLPSQIYPGLGMAKEALELFIVMCARLHCDGLMNIPERYHNAAIYSKRFNYFNPETEGKLLALKRDLHHYSLSDISWAFEWNCILNRSNHQIVRWFTDEQILGVRKSIRDYFKSKTYLKQVEEATHRYQFVMDDKKFDKSRIKHQKAVNKSLKKA